MERTDAMQIALSSQVEIWFSENSSMKKIRIKIHFFSEKYFAQFDSIYGRNFMQCDYGQNLRIFIIFHAGCQIPSPPLTCSIINLKWQLADESALRPLAFVSETHSAYGFCSNCEHYVVCAKHGLHDYSFKWVFPMYAQKIVHSSECLYFHQFDIVIGFRWQLKEEIKHFRGSQRTERHLAEFTLR